MTTNYSPWVIFVVVGLAFMFIGWVTSDGAIGQVMFLVGLVLAVVGVATAIFRRP